MRARRSPARALGSVFTRDWRGAAVAVALLAVVLVLAGLPFAGPRHSQLSAYGDKRDDVSAFREDLEYRAPVPIQVRTVGASAAALDAVEHPTSTLYIAVGVERPYSYAEWSAIDRFKQRGGAVLVADDFGGGGSLLKWVGDPKAPGLVHAGDVPEADWLFSGKRLADVRVDRNPLLVRVDLPVPDGRTLELLLNDPSCFVRNQDASGSYEGGSGGDGSGASEVLAWSSDRSWIDADRDGDRDPGEDAQPYPVIVYEEGMLLVSDPSAFINDMYDRYDNREVLMMLVTTLLPRGGTVVFDESLHIEPSALGEADDHTLRTAMGALGQPYPIWPGLLALLVVLVVAGASARRRPMTFAPHQDRLSERHVLLPGPMTLFADYHEARAVLLQRLRHAYGLDPAELPRLPPDLVAALLGDWELARFALTPAPPDPVALSAALVAIAAWRPPEDAGRAMDLVERYLAGLEGRPRRPSTYYGEGGGEGP